MKSFLVAVVLGLGVFGGAAAAAEEAATATLVVRLPADARLTVDGAPTRSTKATRWLVTPPLAPGKDFRYTLRAEFVRGDSTVTVTRVVAVRAGRRTEVSLEPPPAAAERVVFPPQDGRTRTAWESDGPPPNRVLPMDQQDPMRGAGFPGQNDFGL